MAIALSPPFLVQVSFHASQFLRENSWRDKELTIRPWNLPNGQNGHFEFNFVIKLQVDYFDHGFFMILVMIMVKNVK